MKILGQVVNQISIIPQNQELIHIQKGCPLVVHAVYKAIGICSPLNTERLRVMEGADFETALCPCSEFPSLTVVIDKDVADTQP